MVSEFEMEQYCSEFEVAPRNVRPLSAHISVQAEGFFNLKGMRDVDDQPANYL